MTNIEWPKWVEVHESHIEKDHFDNRVVHGFEFHDDRVTKKVTVIVHTPEEELYVTSPKDNA